MVVSEPDVIVDIRELSIDTDFLPDEADLRRQIRAAVTQAAAAWAAQNGAAGGADQHERREALQRGLTEAVGSAVQRMGDRA